MTDLQGEIIQWLHTQPDWLQETAEYLLEHGSTDDEAIQNLSEHLKTPDGQKVTTHRVFSGLSSASSPPSALRLTSIGNIQGIENLSPRKPLQFGLGNLTVIYGHNGSGKTSYTRILKKVCGKPRAKELKPNVFLEPPTDRHCIIEFNAAGTKQSATWAANSPPINVLEPTDIFDGDAADFYLCGESDVSYVPPVVALFEELAGACDRIKALLQAEQNQLVSKLPALPAEYEHTTAGTTYLGLKPRMSKDSLRAVLEWSASDQKELGQLTERLKVADPVLLARQKRAKKQQLDLSVTVLQNAATAVSKEACKNLQELKRAAVDQRRRATEGAKANTASAKLNGIGTDTWIELWKAAKAYSVEQAYPGAEYPVTDDISRCVLCHQALDGEAKIRLQDFEGYVQGKLEAAARLAEETCLAAIKSLPASPSEAEIQTSCQAAGLVEDVWLERINRFWQDYRSVGEACKKAESDIGIEGLEAPATLIAELNALSHAIEAEALQHEIDAKEFDRKVVAKQKLELDAKLWTSQQTTAIQAEIDRLGKNSEFEKWKKHANSRNISLKSGDISLKAITGAYVERFNNELKDLGARRIKVELVKTRIERGKVKHRIQLLGVTNRDDAPETVLSDGERRVVALAAFLADVAGKPDFAPFVFDDPISSLDHDFEWEVAMRLAKLAKDRQVLVFTHRLSLYGAMEDAAKKCGEEWKKNNHCQICIEAFSGTTGHPVDEAVWNANTKKANNILITRLTDAKEYWDLGESDNYRIHAQSICTDFRKLLERTVEDDLLSQVVKRHRRSITTDNRITHLPKITKDDCIFLDGMMTKYSCYEHSQSQETPVFLPDEPELRQDIEALKVWREKFKERAVEVSK